MPEEYPRPPANAGELTIKDRTYYEITDVRAQYLKSILEKDGASWNSTRKSYVFAAEDKPGFDRAVARISTMPYIELSEEVQKQARYADEDLYRAGIFAEYVPVYELKPGQDPKSVPTKKHYVVTSEEQLKLANNIAFEGSRATKEQVDSIRRYIADGRATMEILGNRTAGGFERDVENKALSQTDAKDILRRVEPAPEQAVKETQKFLQEGRISDALLAKLHEEGTITDATADLGVAGLTAELAKPSREQTIVAEQVYAINGAAKKQATFEQRVRVQAHLDQGNIQLSDLGAMGEDALGVLTESRAKQLIGSGNTFLSDQTITQEYENTVASLRENFTLGVERSTFSGQDGTQRRVHSNGTAQGAEATAADKLREAIKNGVPGLVAGATQIPWPTRGFAAGKLVFAEGRAALFADDDHTAFYSTGEDVKFQKDHQPTADRVGEYYAFEINRKGEAWGQAVDAQSQGAAICELDARLAAAAMQIEYKTATLEGPATGTVFALRGDYATVQIENDGFATVPLGQLNVETPEFNQTVTIASPNQAPATPAQAGGVAAPTVAKTTKRGGRS